MGGMLIDNHQTVAGLRDDIIRMHLPTRRPQGMIDKFGIIGHVNAPGWSHTIIAPRKGSRRSSGKATICVRCTAKITSTIKQPAIARRLGGIVAFYCRVTGGVGLILADVKTTTAR